MLPALVTDMDIAVPAFRFLRADEVMAVRPLVQSA